MSGGMHTYSPSGAPHERTRLSYAWALPRGNRTGRNGFDLRASCASAPPAQTCPAVGRPGLPWDVALYVPMVVLMVVKNLNSREMEAYLAENVVARVFIGRQDDPRAQIRDHSNI